MKSFYLFIMFLIIYIVPVMGQPKGFSERFVNSLQTRNRDNQLKDKDQQLLVENINKEISADFRKQTNQAGKIDVDAISSQNVSKIIHAIIKTEKEFYKSENEEYKIFSVNKICSFAHRFSERYPNETRIEILNYLNNTNNWKVSEYKVFTRLLGGADKSFCNISNELLNKYITLYRKLSCERKKEYKRTPPNFKGDRPVRQLMWGVENCLQEFSKNAPMPKLEKMLQSETNESVIGFLLYGVRGQPSDEAYKVYAKYYPKSVKHSTKSEIRRDLRGFRRTCTEYENWKKQLKAASYDKEKAEKQFKSKVNAMNKSLSSISLNNPQEILLLPEKLQEAEDLSNEKPRAGISLDRYLKPIRRNPVVECKEAYWQILQREPDEDKYDIEGDISITFGEAYGKVMTKEDVSKVIDYMNTQKSFKLLLLKEKTLDKIPKVYKANAIIGIVEGFRWYPRKEIIREFYKNKEKIKDRLIKKSIIEMAENAGVTNAPVSACP